MLNASKRHIYNCFASCTSDSNSNFNFLARLALIVSHASDVSATPHEAESENKLWIFYNVTVSLCNSFL